MVTDMDKTVLELTQGWRFHLGECEPAWYKGYDDSGWRKVCLPHDWSVEAPFSKEYSSGTGYVQGGIGWYRLRFPLPEEYRGKSIRITFDGVYKNSQVWCNSYYLGKRPGGYTTFSYDISDFAVFGEAENEISVKVTHTDIADSRWFTGSGITRKVTLTVEERVHPAEYGCFFETLEAGNSEALCPCGAKSARVRVTHEAVNASAEPVRLFVETALIDGGGAETLRMKGELVLDGRPGGSLQGKVSFGQGRGQLTLEGEVLNPALWSVDSPSLYTMKTWYRTERTDVSSGSDGSGWYLADEEKVGIRTFSFDPDRGFFLNGKSMKLKGVCAHHDGGCLGAAMKAEVWQRRLALLKDCGCNAIRCSHNPHMPELYGLCDAMGFVVMDEAFDEWENPKNKWSTGHNVYPPKHQGYYENFHQWHEADLRAMVRRDRNHPSVLLYSIGNEIDYPNDPYCHPMFDTMTGNNDADKPAAERQFDADKPNAERLAVLAAHLADIVRKEDTSRPVTLAAAFPELSSRLGFLDPLDVAGYNYKEHLYEEDHRRFPGKPFLGSENGHSYRAWRAVTDHDYISGQFLWTGIDYLGEAHGWPVYGSPAGIVTTAGFAKPEWYRRRAFWGSEPGLHMAVRPLPKPGAGRPKWGSWFLSHSWNYEPGTGVAVRCFVNEEYLPEGAVIELALGDKVLGRAAVGHCPEWRWSKENPRMPEEVFWEDGAYCFPVSFEAGRLTARCLSAEGAPLDSCALETAGEAEKLDCQIWQADDALTGESFALASGRAGYLYQLMISLKDAQGRDVVWQERNVRAQVFGDGELAGIDSGNLGDVTPYPENARDTFMGRLAVYVRRTGSGPIRVLLTDTGNGAQWEGCISSRYEEVCCAPSWGKRNGI